MRKFITMTAVLRQAQAQQVEEESKRLRNTLFETEILEIEARDLESERNKYLPNRSF
jgi:hypothetical protein